jgi:Gpi18-like mannosyltransferase
MLDFLAPWFSKILTDGFSAMAGDYTNYSPPYLYLLGLVATFSPFASAIFLIKLVSILFTLFAAIIFGIIVMEITHNSIKAIVCACLFPLIPSVAINAAWWGQCDIIYTSLIMCAFLASIKRSPFLVMFFFSTAFAFKAQAIFFAPFLLYLALKKELPWKYAAVVPVVYVCMMFPAWFAGRPALELATIYLNQGNFYKALSMHAPNPWAFIEKYRLMPYEIGLITGLLAAILANLVLVVHALRSVRDDTTTKLLLIASTMIVSPYLLPKMHDRYFFPADVFTVLLCVLLPKYRLSALAMQIASTAVYVAYLKGSSTQQDNIAIVASAFTSIALIWILYLSSVYSRLSGGIRHFKNGRFRV